MSLDKVYYQGEELEIDVDDTTIIAYYQHIYRTSYDNQYSRHMCMKWGVWCWKQAREHPIDAIKYLSEHFTDRMKVFIKNISKKLDI